MTQKIKKEEKKKEEAKVEDSNGRNLVPKSFFIFGHEFSIVFQDELIQEEEAVGTYRHGKHLITIQNNKKGATILKSRQEQTFFHELTHCILDQMGEEKLYHNEKFVDLFSQCLHQILKTAKY